MKFNIPFSFGDPVYIKSDPDQEEYTFVGFVGRPGSIAYMLDYLGEEIEVYDFQVSKEKNTLKPLGVDKRQQEEE